MALARGPLGRRWLGFGLAAITIMTTTVVVESGSVARAADPVTQTLASAMETLGDAIAAGSSLQQAAEAVPFTGISPALAGGLDMLQSLQGTLGQLKNNA